ncbi:MAG TPA: MBL fold metallo-hydrolase [Bryobacteraceae bacterium]|nr:MBL fold metallo-hydrolase [Bryobacteraceae bacterium]
MRKLFLLGLLTAAILSAQSRPMDIYWIDTEGGAATLIVTPSGQSLLADTGNPGPADRDAKRIFDVAKMAGLTKIDILLTTHFHSDHVGGAPALAKMIPIGKYYDHGDSIEASTPQGAKLYDAYKATAGDNRTVVKPGDKIPLHDVQVTVVTSNGEVIAKPLAGGGPNPLCKDAQTKPPDTTENQRSAGFLLTYGRFKFLDLGDLTWDKEMELACPVEKLGTVTLLQATHHGFFGDYSGAPALYWAIKPEVVVVNNGARKGLATNAYNTIAGIPGIEGIWQMHRSVANDEAHNTVEPMIANTDPASDGHWVKASVEKDGKFTITNSRNDYSKTYTTR